jgi:hypothetical protein
MLGSCVFLFTYILSSVFWFIVLPCVLFVCKYVVYYCRRFSTKLQLTKYICHISLKTLNLPTWTLHLSKICYINNKNCPTPKPYETQLNCMWLKSEILFTQLLHRRVKYRLYFITDILQNYIFQPIDGHSDIKCTFTYLKTLFTLKKHVVIVFFSNVKIMIF